MSLTFFWQRGVEADPPGRAGVEVVPRIYVPGEYRPRELS